MYIVAIAWIYVVFMMSVTETSVVAGIMTFVFYGALPVGIIVYVMGTGRRRRRRRMQEKLPAAAIREKAGPIETATSVATHPEKTAIDGDRPDTPT
jgi:hypothetical protein